MLRVVAGRPLALVLAGMTGLAATQAWADGPDVDWTGFYAGAQLGGAWADADWTYENANYFNTLGAAVVGNKFSHDPSGVIGGVLGGYNYQTGPWLIGLELQASAADVRQERPSPLFPKLDTATTQIEWLASAAARLGYTWDRWLIFARGGWAGADIKLRMLDQSAAVLASENKWANGWTVGGGGEYMIWDHISLGVTYDYTSIDVDSETIACAACAGPPNQGFGVPIVDGDVTVQSVMGRLTFHQ